MWTVEDAAHLIRDRFVHVGAFDEHGVDRGDRAFFALPAAFEQTRQERKHARRIATPRGRLARSETDLALRARDARHGVDQQHHALSLIAEEFGNRGGALCRA